MLDFRTFGGVVLTDAEGHPYSGAATQRRRLALLAVLASAGSRGASRDKLVGLLWPERDAEKARHALAQWLFLLRRDLRADGVVVGTTELRLDPSKIRCDVAEFDRAIARGDAAGAEEALAQYAGAFLEGFFLTGAPPAFERWVDEERERRARQARAAAELLAMSADAAGDAQRAVRWWGWLAERDPLSSRGAMGYMRALAAADDRARAVQHARVHAELVRQELESDPDPRVLALAEALRRARRPPWSGVVGRGPRPRRGPHRTGRRRGARPSRVPRRVRRPLPDLGGRRVRRPVRAVHVRAARARRGLAGARGR